MFRTLSKLVPEDKDLPPRAHRLGVLNRFLDDSIYDVLDHEFHEEYNGAGEYIPIAQRAPSVRYGLLQTVVNDSVSFLFAEGRFPSVDAGEEESEDFFKKVIKDTALNDVLIDAAQRGSVGSVAIWMRVLANRVFFKALETTFLTPSFKANAPDVLEKVVERYKVKGRALREGGYTIADDDLETVFWFQREWNETHEFWFKPTKVSDQKFPKAVDNTAGRTTKHGLGFVPLVWIKNLPGGDDLDGACTFKIAIPNSIEINYQLSQAGRGLKYSSSPTLVIKDAASLTPKNKMIAGDALVVPPEGDAKLLEISGGAAQAVLEYVEGLRKMALEGVGGSRADSDKLSAATSGRAMEMMNQALINLSDKLRSSYGENGLLRLIKMVAAVSCSVNLVDRDGNDLGKAKENLQIALVWPRWFAPTADDRQADANALGVLKGSSLISTETAVRSIASDYDVEDVEAEIKAIADEVSQAQANQVELKAAQPKISPPER